jgi:hypothetical protein
MTEILKKPVWYYQVLEKLPSDKTNENLNAIYPVPYIRLNSESLYRWQLYKNQTFNLLQPNKLINISSGSKFLSNNEWKFDFSIGLKSEEEDLYRQRTTINHAIRDKSKSVLWVQYSVPFLLPLTIGLILSFFQINLIYSGLNFFFK